MTTEDDDVPAVYLLYVVGALAVIAIVTLGLCFVFLP